MLRPAYRYAVLLAAGVLVAAACAWIQLSRQTVYFETEFHSSGENLLRGVRTRDAALCMPLTGLTLSLARRGGEAGVKAAGAALSLLAYLLLFAAGAAGGGVMRGLLFAACGALINLPVKAHEMEQLVYAPLLLLYAGLEATRERGRPGASAAAGLALGLSLLARSPLFAFPPLLLLLRRLSGEKDPRGEAAYLLCSYALLLPWLGLTRSLTGGLRLFEGARLECILITGAQGCVFAPVAYDCRAFAGIPPEANVYLWALKTAASSPLVYAAGVARRLWQAFLMFPGLFAMALLALPLRRREDRPTALLAAYFLGVHCLLALEERYLYPLRYLLLMLGLSGAWRVLFGETAPSPLGRRIMLGALALTAAGGLAASALVIRLQLSSEAPEAAVRRGLAAAPADPWLLRKRAELGLHAGKDWRAGAELKDAGPYGAALAALADALEAGDGSAAAREFRRAREIWEEGRNGLRSAPYALDRELDARIRASNRALWDNDIYEVLLGRRPEKRPRMLALLNSITPLTPKLRYMAAVSGPPDAASGRAVLALLPETGLPPWLDAPDAALRLLAAALDAAPACSPADGTTDGLVASAMAAQLRSGVTGLARRFSPDQERVGRPEVEALSASLRGGGPGALPAGRNPVYGWLSYRLSGCRARSGPGFDAFAAAAAAGYYLDKGRRAEAARLLASADAASADRAAALRLALAAQRLGDYPAGLRFAARAVALAPRDPEALNQRAVLRRLSGDRAGAEADLRSALAAAPDYFPAALNLGSLLDLQGKSAGAAEAYRAALAAAGLPEAERDRIRARLAAGR